MVLVVLMHGSRLYHNMKTLHLKDLLFVAYIIILCLCFLVFFSLHAYSIFPTRLCVAMDTDPVRLCVAMDTDPTHFPHPAHGNALTSFADELVKFGTMTSATDPEIGKPHPHSHAHYH